MSAAFCGLEELSDFVGKFSSWTETVKRLLEQECDEARYVLKAWPIETLLTKTVDPNLCTCQSEASLENCVEEIGEGIKRALIQAQELREKIALNVSKQKRKAREPDVQAIYAPNGINQKNKMPASKTEKSAKVEKKSEGGVQVSKPVFQKSQKKTMQSSSKNVADRKLLRVSTSIPTVHKAKAAKNFVAANKSSVRSTKRDAQLKTVGSSETNTCSGPTNRNSIAELTRLMEKVSSQEARLLSGSPSELPKDDTCPCHGKNAPTVVQERVITRLDIIEALDRFGLHEDLVRVLKLYRGYSLREFTVQKSDKRGERAASRFLNEFQLMNEQRNAEEERNVSEQFNYSIVGFAHLLRELQNRSSITTSAAVELNNSYIQLDSRSKICRLKKFHAEEYEKSGNPRKASIEGRGWASNGVWNRLRTDCFPDVRGTHCIRYANRSQLSTFFDLVQRYQQLLYHDNLIQLLIETVIPEIRISFKKDTRKYSQAYKMMSAIAQVLNPTVAVLVRTDI